MNNSTLDQGAIDAIVGGYHGAPFDILGPHIVDGAMVIRAFRPDAERIDVAIGAKEPVPMVRVHDAGLFEATLTSHKKLKPYQLAVTHHGGQSQLYEDPYALSLIHI